jgi:stringent starvation protein B
MVSGRYRALQLVLPDDERDTVQFCRIFCTWCQPNIYTAKLNLVTLSSGLHVPHHFVRTITASV